jgi:hypothetical protein
VIALAMATASSTVPRPEPESVMPPTTIRRITTEITITMTPITRVGTRRVDGLALNLFQP